MTVCGSCHAVSMDARPVRTDVGTVQVGVCHNCDRRRCGACRKPLMDVFARKCGNCGHRSDLVGP